MGRYLQSHVMTFFSVKICFVIISQKNYSSKFFTFYIEQKEKQSNNLRSNLKN